MQMRIRITWLMTAVLFLACQIAFAQKDTSAQEVAPDVPSAVAVPSGLAPVLFVHAKGSQIYTCAAGTDGKFAWTLKAPDAELKDRKDKVIDSTPRVRRGS